MIPFLFHIPTRVRFGRGVADELPGLPQVAGKRIMLLTFPGFGGKELLTTLGAGAAAIVEIDDFQENPTYEYAQALAARVDAEEIDAIVAIGGGSSIDSAKAAAHLAERTPEVVALPTTAGTGSEVTPYAILTDEAGNKRILNDVSLFPDVALCDPVLTLTMPPSVTANTGVDALSHAIEGYLSVKCQGVVLDLALSAMPRIAKSLPLVMEDPTDLTAREDVMLAALEAGLVLAMCGTVMVHALGYQVTKHSGWPHGLSNAVLLASLVDVLAERRSSRAMVISEMFHGDLRGFIECCGIDRKLPKLNRGTLNMWVEAGYESYGRPNCVAELTRDDIRSILTRSME